MGFYPVAVVLLQEASKYLEHEPSRDIKYGILSTDTQTTEGGTSDIEIKPDSQRANVSKMNKGNDATNTETMM
jgi:hypothetical protein